MHLRAGRFFGELPTCGEKIDYGSEGTAAKAAEKLSARNNSEKEAYPCYWCDGWHIGRKMTEKERRIFSDPDLAESVGKGETILVDVAEPIFGIQLGKTKLRVHSGAVCYGEFCSIHNPSMHPLREAPLNWRSDTRVMERICEHGVGHPDPDDANYRMATQGKRYEGTIHGCDGCCVNNFGEDENN